MGLLLDEHDEVARGPAPRPGVSHAAQRDEVPARDPPRHLDRDRVGLGQAPLAAALAAALAHHPALAPALRTGRDVHELPEDGLLHAPHLPAPLALGAGALARPAPPVAGRAGPQVLHPDLLLDPGGDLLEREPQPDLQVVAAPQPRARRAAAPPPNRSPKPPMSPPNSFMKARNASARSKPLKSKPCGPAPPGGRVPELVVAGALLRVAQHLVRLGGLLEALLGFLVAGVPVGVALEGDLAVGLLDLVLARPRAARRAPRSSRAGPSGFPAPARAPPPRARRAAPASRAASPSAGPGSRGRAPRPGTAISRTASWKAGSKGCPTGSSATTPWRAR